MVTTKNFATGKKGWLSVIRLKHQILALAFYGALHVVMVERSRSLT